MKFYFFKFKKTCRAVWFAVGPGFEETHDTIKRIFGGDTDFGRVAGNLFLLFVAFILKVENFA